MTALALDEHLPPTARDYIQTARESSQLLLTIINDMLDFSKIEAGQMTTEQVPFNLRQSFRPLPSRLPSPHRADPNERSSGSGNTGFTCRG